MPPKKKMSQEGQSLNSGEGRPSNATTATNKDTQKLSSRNKKHTVTNKKDIGSEVVATTADHPVLLNPPNAEKNDATSADQKMSDCSASTSIMSANKLTRVLKKMNTDAPALSPTNPLIDRTTQENIKSETAVKPNTRTHTEQSQQSEIPTSASSKSKWLPLLSVLTQRPPSPGRRRPTLLDIVGRVSGSSLTTGSGGDKSSAQTDEGKPASLSEGSTFPPFEACVVGIAAGLLLFTMLLALLWFFWCLIEPYATGIVSGILLSVVFHFRRDVLRRVEKTELKRMSKRRHYWCITSQPLPLSKLRFFSSSAPPSASAAAVAGSRVQSLLTWVITRPVAHLVAHTMNSFSAIDILLENGLELSGLSIYPGLPGAYIRRIFFVAAMSTTLIVLAEYQKKVVFYLAFLPTLLHLAFYIGQCLVLDIVRKTYVIPQKWIPTQAAIDNTFIKRAVSVWQYSWIAFVALCVVSRLQGEAVEVKSSVGYLAAQVHNSTGIDLPEMQELMVSLVEQLTPQADAFLPPNVTAALVATVRELGAQSDVSASVISSNVEVQGALGDSNREGFISVFRGLGNYSVWSNFTDLKARADLLMSFATESGLEMGRLWEHGATMGKLFHDAAGVIAASLMALLIAFINNVLNVVNFLSEAMLFVYTFLFFTSCERSVVYSVAHKITSVVMPAEDSEAAAVEFEERTLSRLYSLFASLWQLALFHFVANLMVFEFWGAPFAVTVSFLVALLSLVPVLPAAFTFLPGGVVPVGKLLWTGQYGNTAACCIMYLVAMLYSWQIPFFNLDESSNHNHDTRPESVSLVHSESTCLDAYKKSSKTSLNSTMPQGVNQSNSLNPAPKNAVASAVVSQPGTETIRTKKAGFGMLSANVMRFSVALGFVSFGLKGVVLGPLTLIGGVTFWDALGN